MAFGIFTFKSPANLYFYKKFTHIDGNITFTTFSLDLVFSRRNPSVTNQYPYIYLAQRYCRIIFLVTIIFIDYHKTIRKQLLDDGVDNIDDKMAMLMILMMLVVILVMMVVMMLMIIMMVMLIVITTKIMNVWLN